MVLWIHFATKRRGDAIFKLRHLLQVPCIYLSQRIQTQVALDITVAVTNVVHRSCSFVRYCMPDGRPWRPHLVTPIVGDLY